MSEDNQQDQNRKGMLSGMISAQSLAMPIAFALYTGALAGYFGKLGFFELILLALAAVSIQVVSEMARIVGDQTDRQDAKNEYYERKFAQFKNYESKNRFQTFDPAAGTAGSLDSIKNRSVLMATAAISLVLGYSLIIYCLGTNDLGGVWMAFAIYLALVAAAILRYMGTWKFGYKVYGNAIVFALVSIAGVMGGFYLLTGTFIMVVVYPAIGFGAFAVAAANIGDIERENSDADFEDTDNPRTTVPLSAGINAAMLLQTASLVLGMIWMASFPMALGLHHIWSYAFMVMFVPIIASIIRTYRAKPKDIPGIRTSLVVAMLIMSAAFFLSVASANLGAAFLMV